MADGFALDPSLSLPSDDVPQVQANTQLASLAEGAREAIEHISELTEMEVALVEGSVAVVNSGSGSGSGSVRDIQSAGGVRVAEEATVAVDEDEDEGGYSPSQPQGLDLDMDDIAPPIQDPYSIAPIDAPSQHAIPDETGSNYSPSAPRFLVASRSPSPERKSDPTFTRARRQSDDQSDADADAEGEIDMDLGTGGEEDVFVDVDEQDAQAQRAGDVGQTGDGLEVGSSSGEMTVDPALLGLTGLETVPASSLSGAEQDNQTTRTASDPSVVTAPNDPTQSEDIPRQQRAPPHEDAPESNPTYRRPPNARRRSPSYTMLTETEDPATRKIGGNSGPGSSGIGGNGGISSIDAPLVPPPAGAGIPPRPPTSRAPIGVHPSPNRMSSFANNNNNKNRQDFVQKFDFADLVLPSGLDVKTSGSVRLHPVLISAWSEAKAKQSPALLSHTTHALFEAARQDGDVEEARIWFAEFEVTNPTATGPLLNLINLELAHGNFIEVVGLYEKALRGLGGGVGAVPGVGIWVSYLHYIRRQNPIPAPTATNAAHVEMVRQIVKSAYDLALKECGNDIAAGEIWKEYVAFLEEKVNTNAWEIQQQVDAIRKVYQRAVAIPMYDVEAIWREYDAFENKQNKMTAKKFLAERSPLYMTARTALRDLRSHLENLVPLDVPPRPTWTQSDRDLVIAWRKYLKWEETNPLDIDDPTALQARVLYGMKKCLTQMRFFPELWYHTSSFALSQNKPDDAAAYLKNGLEANPTSFLLTFAYAEYEEGQKNAAGAKGAFENLIKHHGDQIDKLKASIAEEVEKAKGPEIEGEKDAAIGHDDVDIEGAAPTQARKRYLEREARGAAAVERRAKELEELMSAAGVVWIMYMRFARRAEGLKLARSVFTQARKSSYVSWQVFEASAYMEYHCNKDASVATKIFELGLKAFPDEVAFAVKFLQFQLQINDDSNARALFERLALKFPPEKARPIWDAWARYEYLYSDLSSCQKLEARFAEAYPTDAPLKRFAARYNYLGLDEIAIRDLGFGLRTPAPAPAPSATKRSLPDDSPGRSPRQEQRYRDDRGPPMRNEPPSKRSRPMSREREQPRRNMPPGDGGYYGGGRREPSPPPRRLPDRPPPLPVAPPPAPSEPLDRSGLPVSIVRFLGNLPSVRTFDGPIFRAEDLMNVIREARIPGGLSRPADFRGPPPVGRSRF